MVVDDSFPGFDCGTGVTLPDAIEGTGSLTQEGSGTLTLTGPNSYSGMTTISAGTLQIDAGGPIGSLGTGPVTDDSRSCSSVATTLRSTTRSAAADPSPRRAPVR